MVSMVCCQPSCFSFACVKQRLIRLLAAPCCRLATASTTPAWTTSRSSTGMAACLLQAVPPASPCVSASLCQAVGPPASPSVSASLCQAVGACLSLLSCVWAWRAEAGVGGSNRLADSLQSIGTQLLKSNGNNQSLIRRAEDETENGRVLSQVRRFARARLSARLSASATPRKRVRHRRTWHTSVRRAEAHMLSATTCARILKHD